MKIVRKILLPIAFLLMPILTVSSAHAGGKDKVQKFYDFLSNPGSQVHAEAFSSAVADDWESIGNYSGKNKSKEAFIGQMGGFSKLIPNLNWEVQSMQRSGKSVVVRSRATGTPTGPLFGVDGQGRSFDIMTIDIHEFKKGRIARTYHIEDWSGALAQLSGPQVLDQSKESIKVVEAFMGAMGSGDMDKMSALMADDMIWHNEGDSDMPWIGPWKGKEQIFGFLKVFSENLKTTKWENENMFASGDTVAVFGRMNGVTTKSGKEIGEFTFALRVKVRDGKVVLWNWFEDSYAVSNAFHGR